MPGHTVDVVLSSKCSRFCHTDLSLELGRTYILLTASAYASSRIQLFSTTSVHKGIILAPTMLCSTAALPENALPGRRTWT